MLYAVISLIDWRCHLFGGGDKEIAGTGIWIAPGHARINENVWLSELPLAFTIRAHTPASEIGAEGRIGWLRTNVERLVNSLDLALNRQAIKEVEEADGRRENPSKERLWIWRRGNPVTVFQEGLKSTARRTVDRGELNDVTLSYLQKSYLRSDLLEWIIVDAFVLYEIQEFGETIKQGTGFRSLLRYWARDGRLRVGASLWQLILVPMILAGWIAGLAYVTPRTGESTLASLLVFGAYVVFFMWLTGRPIFLSRSGKAQTGRMLLPEMVKVYALLGTEGGVISPYAIRNALLELHDISDIYNNWIG